MKWTPHKYQQEDVKFLVERRAACYLAEPGLGKSAVTLKAFQILRAAGKVRSMLIFAPLRVCYNVWSQIGEIGKWNDFAGLRVALLHGSKKEAALAVDADIYVINYEGIPWLTQFSLGERATRLARLIQQKHVDLLVYDELSKMKHPRTKRFKLLKPYLPVFRRRWGLTGSPCANNLLDLFGECYAVDLGGALGQFITHFRMKYFYPTGFRGYEWRPQPGAQEKIFDAIKDLARTRRATDHLDLPTLVQENIWVDLPEKARVFYDRFEADMIAEIEGQTFTAGSAGVVSGKCRQIAAGGLYVPEMLNGPLIQLIHDAKTEALRDLVEELQGAPLFVGIGFHHDRARIRALLGKNIPSLDGDCTQKEASDIIKCWNAGEIPVLMFHPASASHGLNMQACNCAHVCWYTPTWDREQYDQSIARAWRQGSNAERVIVHRILARDTVDSVVVRALGAKDRTQRALFDALKEYARERKKNGSASSS